MIYVCSGIARCDAGFWWRAIESKQDVERLKTLPNRQRKELLSNLGFDEKEKANPRQAIPADRLRLLLDWADLGAHTRFHPILTRCEDRECQEEIALSKDELLPFGIALHDFAFPNGDYSDREIAFVKAAGFRSARTTEPGWVSPSSDRFRLKAIAIDDTASVDKFAVVLTGLPGLVKSFLAKRRGRALQPDSLRQEPVAGGG